MQFGNSEATQTDYPLFKVGGRMILSLKKAGEFDYGVDFDYDYNKSYWIIGGPTTIMDVQMVDNTLYVGDRMGVMTEEFLSNKSIGSKIELSLVNRDTSNKFHEQIKSSDPILSEIENLHRNIFLYDEIVKTVEDIGK